jgi:hypothetical protein
MRRVFFHFLVVFFLLLLVLVLVLGAKRFRREIGWNV